MRQYAERAPVSPRRAKLPDYLVYHSDHGNQDLSIRYKQRLAAAGIQSSIGSGFFHTKTHRLKPSVGFARRKSSAKDAPT